MNYNKILLIGNITREPQLSFTPNQTAIITFGLAVNRKWKTESGEEKEEVTFVDIDAFGKQAEVLGQYVRKGNPLFVQGRLKLETWDDKTTGKKRSRLGVVLESFQFLASGKGRDDGESAPTGQRGARADAPASGPGGETDVPPQEGG